MFYDADYIIKCRVLDICSLTLKTEVMLRNSFKSIALPCYQKEERESPGVRSGWDGVLISLNGDKERWTKD